MACGRWLQVVDSMFLFSEKQGLPQGALPDEDLGCLWEPARVPPLPHSYRQSGALVPYLFLQSWPSEEPQSPRPWGHLGQAGLEKR